MAKVISAVNQKGGSGKTTSVIELATNLANLERKVLIIDLDPQENLSDYIPSDIKKPTIDDVLHGRVAIKDAIQRVNNYDVIIGSEELSEADKVFTGFDDIYLLKDVVDMIKDEYDYIFIDTNPSRSILLTMTYVATDYIIVSLVCDTGSIKGLKKVYRDIREMRESKRHVTDAKILTLILNAFKSNESNDQVQIEDLYEISEQIEDHPMVASIRTFTGVKACKRLKMSISEYDKHSNAAIDFKNLAWDIDEKLEGGLS